MFGINNRNMVIMGFWEEDNRSNSRIVRERSEVLDDLDLCYLLDIQTG